MRNLSDVALIQLLSVLPPAAVAEPLFPLPIPLFGIQVLSAL